MNAAKPFPLNDVAEAYANHLFDYNLRARLGHHISHVASENWLAMELAYAFNTTKNNFDLGGWDAVLEKQRVDVTLLPPSDPTNESRPIYIECKMVGPPYWEVWKGINTDLAGKSSVDFTSSKPPATFAVCFLYEILSQSTPNQRSATRDRDREYLASVPTTAGRFKPHSHELEFQLLHSSKSYLLEWPEPIPGRWPFGFAAAMRILWIEKTTDSQI